MFKLSMLFYAIDFHHFKCLKSTISANKSAEKRCKDRYFCSLHIVLFLFFIGFIVIFINFSISRLQFRRKNIYIRKRKLF